MLYEQGAESMRLILDYAASTCMLDELEYGDLNEEMKRIAKKVFHCLHSLWSICLLWIRCNPIGIPCFCCQFVRLQVIHIQETPLIELPVNWDGFTEMPVNRATLGTRGHIIPKSDTINR